MIILSKFEFMNEKNRKKGVENRYRYKKAHSFQNKQAYINTIPKCPIKWKREQIVA